MKQEKKVPSKTSGQLSAREKLKLKKEKKANKTNKKVLFRNIFLGMLLLGVIGLVVVAIMVASILKDAPELNYDDLAPTGYTSFIRDQNGTVIQELSTGESNRIYVEIDEIPTHVKNAFIAIEDQRFYEHNGIDLRGIFRAVFVNLKERNLSEGASTITQQVIKNNLLTFEKTFNRKIIEQHLAIQVEKVLDKDTILELYLNTVGLGRGTNGVQAAANRYFAKDVSELSIAEAAVIAGITQRPNAYEPVTQPENNRVRQEIVLKYMNEQGMITDAELQTALDEKVYDSIQVTHQVFLEQSDFSYFVDEVIRRVAADLEAEKGYTNAQAINLVYRGGLEIYTTQDMTMQGIMDQSFADEDAFPPFEDDYNVMLMYSVSVQTSDGIKHYYDETLFQTDDEAYAHMELLKDTWVTGTDTMIADKSLLIPQPQSAMVVIDYYTGQVKAMTGGRGEKIGNQTLNRATMSLRQPGSTFKILAAYLPALDTAGMTLATVFDDVPYSTKLGDGSTYSPKNWYERATFNYWGLSTLRQGIEWSMNVVTIKAMNEVGVETGFDYLKNLGFTSLVEEETINNQTFSDKNIVLPLGGLTRGVSLLELTAAYGAIANKGNYIEPTFYTKVLSHDGTLLLLNEPETHSAMKETTAFLLTNAMEDVVKTGTGKTTKLSNMPVAGKTGTTSDSKDLAYVGYTPYYVAGIWLGHDTPERMAHNKSYQQILWQNVMAQIHENLETRKFNVPDGLVTKNICTISGKLAVPGLCDSDPRGSRVKTEYFALGTEPKDTCDVHIKVTLCTASGLMPNEYCPDDVLVDKVFTQRLIPFAPEEWDPVNRPRIRDYAYEFPITMIEEYCNIHGPSQPQDDNSFDENENWNNIDWNNGNGNGNGNGNENRNRDDDNDDDNTASTYIDIDLPIAFD
ncbi:MAG: hypothetical protein CVU95_10800 [Firmicutes bacterium HGW-Firmicutes-2]|jgi:penicillin-binding protein 1A|nr:MAG: hypothetical protein CVU95_10800 [Firmicutes bacterium HGW-Firmicutes-2]